MSATKNPATETARQRAIRLLLENYSWEELDRHREMLHNLARATGHPSLVAAWYLVWDAERKARGL